MDFARSPSSISYEKVYIFSRYDTIYLPDITGPYQMRLVSLTSHTFVRFSCFITHVKDLAMCISGLASEGQPIHSFGCSTIR